MMMLLQLYISVSIFDPAVKTSTVYGRLVSSGIFPHGISQIFAVIAFQLQCASSPLETGGAA